MRLIITLIFILIFIQLNGQTEKNYILATNFGYNFTHNDNLDSEIDNRGQNNFGEKNKEFNFSFNVGRKLKKCFYYGLGLSYEKLYQEVNPDTDIPGINESPGFVAMTSYTNSISTDIKISPFIYIQYFNNISDRVSISVDLYTKYDFNTIKTKNIFYRPDITNNTHVISDESETEIEKKNINVGLQPALRFNIFKGFGLEFKVKMIEYRHKTYDSRRNDIDKKTNDLKIGFKPDNWLIGFYLKL